MTCTIGNRIKIEKLINVLNTLTFDEVTTETLQDKLKIKIVVSDFNENPYNMKDIYVDDYCFTIYRTSDEESIGISGYRINDIFLSKEIVVWLPCDDIGSDDIEGTGEIVNHNDFWELHVNYIVD